MACCPVCGCPCNGCCLPVRERPVEPVLPDRFPEPLPDPVPVLLEPMVEVFEMDQLLDGLDVRLPGGRRGGW